MKLKFRTPAKINLGLFVLGKRDDGFHELETLFQMVSLYDQVELETAAAGEVTLECDAPGIPTDGTNLVVRAARMLQQTVPEAARQGCRIRLEKHIPAGAGLGGGSGNAACVLWGLNRLWDLQLERPALHEIAARLGSDIPFFLSAPQAVGRGRGERLTPLEPSEKMHLVIIFPRLTVPTAEVYRRLTLDLTTPPKTISILQKFFSQSDIAGLAAHLHNDLESVVLEGFPVVRQVRDALSALDAKGVLLSGSGSAVFGIFANRDQAERAFSRLQATDWDVFVAETVSRFAEFLPGELLDYP
ncbi:4-(cytidine 5'-diphospho)-2-C-methyl-D-erythritol kinase [Nitrospina watsonii]|uniref:4-diphosphocytidyl-2-C-methyl-D-erythritol kinase n=1 Tax=Nitrospina watsonii TaxID=1323948 RepID=A0ABM9HH11_9BACT|nr:4-(cytidine 5'-diphospho)-2-C-methyl-D-erythritol kinase [Nitrospina watsonii]CAI2719603.1 4-diphosphocytidyl-2-C-methyl-D-erythritol kinase [Nitrospina watsonii]